MIAAVAATLRIEKWRDYRRARQLAEVQREADALTDAADKRDAALGALGGRLDRLDGREDGR